MPVSRSSVRFRLVDLDAAFAALPGLTEREAQRRMAEAVATALDQRVPLLPSTAADGE